MSAAFMLPMPQMAIENARDVYTRRMEGVSIWVVEINNITRIKPGGSRRIV